jgi:hypothetical protein
VTESTSASRTLTQQDYAKRVARFLAWDAYKDIPAHPIQAVAWAAIDQAVPRAMNAACSADGDVRLIDHRLDGHTSTSVAAASVPGCAARSYAGCRTSARWRTVSGLMKCECIEWGATRE